MNKKNREKLILSALFGIFFIIFLYRTFPYDRIKNRIIDSLIEARVVTNMQMSSLTPYWISGVEFSDLSFSTNGRNSYEIESGQLRVSFMSVIRLLFATGFYKFKFDQQAFSDGLTNKVSLKFSFNAYGGKANGALDLLSEKTIKIDSGNFEISKMAFLNDLPGKLKGSGTIKAFGVHIVSQSGTLKDITGQILFDFENGKIDNLDLLLGALTDISISKININLKAQNGAIRIQNFSLSGDIEIKISGTVNLEPTFSYSKINLTISLKAKEDKLGPFKSMVESLTSDSTGMRTIQICNTVMEPKFGPACKN